MKKNITFWLVVVGGIFLLVVLATKGFGLNKAKSDSFINIPLSDVTTEAKWYEYDFDGKKMKFFMVKASDGSIKTAFDACDVCYTEKKGYRQEGDYMICNNCGNRYLIDDLGTKNKKQGGCWPGYLAHTIQGDNILIKESDIRDSL